MELKEKLDNRIKDLEADVNLYNAFINNPETPLDDKKVVSFKLMYETIAFTALCDLTGYTPSTDTALILAGLKGASDYVSIKDGKVEVSPAYKDILKMKDDFIKGLKKN